MQIIASDLREVLARLVNVLTDKGIVEHSEKFVFQKDGIYVFDGETFILSKFDIGIEGSVEGKDFFKYIDKLGTSKIDVFEEGDNLVVQKGKATAQFSLSKEISCPIDLNIDSWRKAPDNLVQALNVCSFTVGQDYTDMRTVVIHVRGEYAESSDSVRITRFKLSDKMKGDFYIPVDVVKFLSRVKITRYAKNEEWIFFENQTKDIVCHRIITFGEDYPDLASIIENSTGGKKIDLPEKMYDAVEKAEIFQQSQKVESDRTISVFCKNNRMRVVSKGSHGNFTETLSVGFDEAFNFSINPDFMMQIMEKSSEIFLAADFIKVQTPEYVYLTSLTSEE